MRLWSLLFLLFFHSCQEGNKIEIKKSVPSFDLTVDLMNFKHKMTELDTIRVFFDHSICLYEGYERLEITKIGDSIRLKSEYKDLDQKNSEWKSLYQEIISLRDTIWDFDAFILRNYGLLDSIPQNNARMQILYQKDRLSFSTQGLTQALAFLRDYNRTMKKLHDPEGFIYGFSETEIEEIKKNIK